ncbi:hook-length control protein FliK [Natronincola peptidivorans]|uniref:Hook-length control protein FliK n=1 Tax=Natronincola peptidivorans TaxID=426128 RepID=A0A1H9YES4_9FIRM|nr:flagellar hook-length control protein FliK [Natronincola peptidivorans]SES67456.1 hook-length control protein FliK [Natronincola peptidivorans]
MIAMDGLMNLKNITNNIRSDVMAGKTNNNDFTQILQSKMQSRNSNSRKTLGLNNDSTRLNNNNSSVGSWKNKEKMKQNNMNTTEMEQKEDNNKSQETEGKTQEDAMNTTNKTEGKKELEESKKPIESEEIAVMEEAFVTSQQMDELMTLINLLHKEGLITVEEVQEYQLQLGNERLMTELLPKLETLLTDIVMKVEKQEISLMTHENIKDFQRTIDSIYEASEKQVIKLEFHNKEEPHDSIKDSSKIYNQDLTPKLDQLENSEITIKETGIEKASSLDNTSKFNIADNYEKLDLTESTLSLDVEKNYQVKFNHLPNESFNTKEIYGKNLLEQLIHKVDAIYKTGKNQLKLQLVPENLGKLSINLSTDNQSVKAKVYVESLMVKEVIENNLNQFRESLRDKGLSLSSIEVSVGQDPEAYQQNRSLMQQRTKLKKTASKAIDNNVHLAQELESITNTNPYIVTTNFDRLG